jgi:hypothetical protein
VSFSHFNIFFFVIGKQKMHTRARFVTMPRYSPYLTPATHVRVKKKKAKLSFALSQSHHHLLSHQQQDYPTPNLEVGQQLVDYEKFGTSASVNPKTLSSTCSCLLFIVPLPVFDSSHQPTLLLGNLKHPNIVLNIVHVHVSLNMKKKDSSS